MVRRAQQLLPAVSIQVVLHQYGLFLSVSQLIHHVLAHSKQARFAVFLFVGIGICSCFKHLLTRFLVEHLHQSVFVEQHHILVLAHLHVLQVQLSMRLNGNFALNVIQPLAHQQPYHTRAVHKQVVHLFGNSELAELILNRLSKSLNGKVNTRYGVRVLKPHVVGSVKVQMVVSTIFRQRILVLLNRVDIREFRTIKEVYLSGCCNHHSASLRTLNGLCAVVGKSVGRSIVMEDTWRHIGHCLQYRKHPRDS